MIYRVSAEQGMAIGRMDIGGRTVRCALGRGGVWAASAKREGDGRTPAGLWPLRRLLWRPDRRPQFGRAVAATALPALPIGPDDGWCDDPGHHDYNRPVRLPHPARAERLWRDDGLYDLLLVLGHNDDPVVPGAGSAIFLHLARPGYEPTEGCVALAADDMVAFVESVRPGDLVDISPSPMGS